MRRPFPPPHTVKFEFTVGCNLACRFCPVSVQEPRWSARSYLRVDDLARWAPSVAELTPHPRIELSMRGEPTLNPDAPALCGILKGCFPRSQLSLFTNGVRFLREPGLIRVLLDAGVNILNIDCYNGTYGRFAALVAALGPARHRFRVEDFRRFSAYRRQPRGHAIRVVNLVPDIAEPGHPVPVRAVHNMAGNAGPAPPEPLVRRCVRPTRELIVMADGSVPLCCHDWGAELVLGHLARQTARQVWYGEPHRSALRALYRKDRAFAPCSSCDYHGGHRVGLLADPFTSEFPA